MSRYCVEHTESKTDTKYGIAFGWDSPLRTFFAQVEAPEDPDNLLVDIGSPFDTLYTNINKFQEAVKEHLGKVGITDFAFTQRQTSDLLDDLNGLNG